MDGHVQADGEVRVAVALIALAAVVAVEDGVAEVGGHGVLAEAGALGEPTAVVVDQREAATLGADVVDDAPDVGVGVTEPVLHEPGVAVRLGAGGGVALLEEEAAGQRVGDEREADRHDQAGDGEGHGDAGPQTEGEPTALLRRAGVPVVSHALHLADPAWCQQRHPARADEEHEDLQSPQSGCLSGPNRAQMRLVGRQGE